MPDYEMTLSTGAILVEVKQLEPNAQDLEMLATLRAGKVAARWVDMGEARLPIMEGVKQLRPHAKGRKPALVVLYDTIGMTGHLDPYSIAFSLYGPEKVHYDVPHSPAQDVTFSGMSRGGRSVATSQLCIAIWRPAHPR
jgi:hypothetical protein